MSKQIGGQQMRDLADKIKKEIPGLGFALLVYEFNNPGIANYISNAQRQDMIKAMKETIERLENNYEEDRKIEDLNFQRVTKLLNIK